MLWQYILTTLSCSLFFVFVILCAIKFGIQSCYSAYGALWHAVERKVNIWSAVTFTTAALLIPSILEATQGSPWQAVAFFCPALLMFVAATPNYTENKFVWTVHGASAGLSALMALLFITFIAPGLWWLIAVYLCLSTVGVLVSGKYSAMFWYEMAAYSIVYTAMFLII